MVRIGGNRHSNCINFGDEVITKFSKGGGGIQLGGRGGMEIAIYMDNVDFLCR